MLWTVCSDPVVASVADAAAAVVECVVDDGLLLDAAPSDALIQGKGDEDAAEEAVGFGSWGKRLSM